MRKTITIKTDKRTQMIDVTSQVAQVLNDSGITDGFVTCYVTHTTAGVTINENADPSVARDILFALDRMVPDKGFTHAEGNSTAHVKSSLMGCTTRVMIQGGTMLLGTWQGIYFCEFDGPRTRRMIVSVD